MNLSKLYLSPSMLLFPVALATAACELPTKLGDIPGASDSASGGLGGGEGGGVEETGGAAVCGGGAAGELAWSHERDELPGFVSGLATAPGGEVVAVGYQGDDAVRDVYVRQYGPDGALQWSQSYAGASGLYDTALAVAVDAAGFVHVLVQEVRALEEGPDFAFMDARLVVLRYAPDGTLAWRWEHAELPFATDGSYEPIGDLGVVGDRIVVLEHEHNSPTLRLELDAAGQPVDEVEVALPFGTDVERLAVAADGSAMIAGDFEVNGTHGIWLGRFTDAGAPAWSDQFGNLDDGVELVLPDGAGGAYFAWRSFLIDGTSEHHLRRYGADGAALWTRTTPSTQYNIGVMDGAIGCDGTLLLTGSFDLPATPDWDLWIARYSGDGTQLWQIDQAFGFREGVKLAATPEGDAVISGNLLDEPPLFEPWLARFGGG